MRGKLETKLKMITIHNIKTDGSYIQTGWNMNAYHHRHRNVVLKGTESTGTPRSR
jgi:hypothetical protein